MNGGNKTSPQPKFGIISQVLYEEFLKNRGNISIVQFVSSLKRAARLLKQNISPALVPSSDAVESVVARMRIGDYKAEKFGPETNALRRYGEMVAENFKGQFGHQPGAIRGTTNSPLPERMSKSQTITPLPTKGRRLLEAIVKFATPNKVDYLDPATYPTYEVLYRAVVPNAPPVIIRVGHNLRKKGLDDLNEWTVANKSLPKVTGLIVDKNKKRPGKGFFPSYGKTPITDDAWWRKEVRKSLAFDWSPYIGTQQATSPINVADDVDQDQIAPRAKGKVSRIVRDTQIARAVKAVHNHTCQLCGLQLILSPGIFYSEAHHLKPLGKPHNGPDRKSNIVCVCPNCHVKLDYHAVRIPPGHLKLQLGHAVGQKYIDHHNKLCP